MKRKLINFYDRTIVNTNFYKNRDNNTDVQRHK